MAHHKISFGNIARTILYEDSLGTIRFTFDVDTSKGQNTIILERGAQTSATDERLRSDLALSRVKEYLTSIGYHVEVFSSE